MTILEASRKVLCALENIEIKGERNIAAMSTAISLVKGIVDGLEQCEREREEEKRHDGDDEQGQDI